MNHKLFQRIHSNSRLYTQCSLREKSEKSVNFDAAQDEFNLAKLPADKASAVVIYCNGPECWKSFKASSAAIKGGYTNVLWYREGFPNWKSKGLSSE